MALMAYATHRVTASESACTFQESGLASAAAGVEGFASGPIFGAAATDVKGFAAGATGDGFGEAASDADGGAASDVDAEADATLGVGTAAGLGADSRSLTWMGGDSPAD